MHETQQVLVDNEVEFRIKLMLYITHNFIMELLSYGANLKVIEPVSLIDEIRAKAEDVRRLYE